MGRAGVLLRARALLQAARFLVEHFDGHLPEDSEKLMQIKGIGPYTTAAILAFGFGHRVAAVDGNVMRVLTRLLAIDADISRPITQKRLRTVATQLLPEKRGCCCCRGFY